MLDHAIDQAICHGSGTREVAITLHVGVHPLELLTGVLGVDLVDSRA